MCNPQVVLTASVKETVHSRVSFTVDQQALVEQRIQVDSLHLV